MKTYKFTKWNGETGEVFECPFCGGKPKVIRKGNSYTKRRGVEISCSNCRCKRNDAAIAHDMSWVEDRAIKNWNQRPYRKDDFILMPKRLTAENGAKSLLIGEFSEKIQVDCPFCLGIGEDEEGERCTECGGSGDDTREVQISWTNIKKIYAMTVKHFAGK